MTTRSSFTILRKFFRGDELLSPRGLLTRSCLIVFVFFIFHLLGWREETSVLAGALAGPGQNVFLHAAMGVVYVAMYFAVVILVPIVVIASGILWVLLRWNVKEIDAVEGKSNV